MNRKWIIISAISIAVVASATAGTIYYLKTRGPKPISSAELQAAMDPMKLSTMQADDRKALLDDIAKRLPTMSNDDIVKTAQEMGGAKIALLAAQLNDQEKRALVEPIAEAKKKEFTNMAKEYYALPPSKRKEALDARLEQFNGYRSALSGVAGGIGGGRRGGPGGPRGGPGGPSGGPPRDHRPGSGHNSNRPRKEVEAHMLSRAQHALSNTSSEDRAVTMAYMEELRKRQRENEGQR
ncbi:MAG TPA: hypothetical protein PL033_19390 [Candidatus Brocadiia bacterium]|nr:hypothetical protein [Candidatus Brocadiia bacterium]